MITGCCCSTHRKLSSLLSVSGHFDNTGWPKVFLKHQANWNIVCGAKHDLPWCNIWSVDNHVEVLNEQLSLLIGCSVPTKVIHVHNKNKPWCDKPPAWV